MSTVIEAIPVTMSVEEFLALPEDGLRRELIRGEVRERGMAVRNRVHSRVMGRLAQHFNNWLDTHPHPKGIIHVGDAGFRLRGTADSLVGIDLAYASPALVAATPRKQAYYDGPPVLAIEILSPSDTQEDIFEKVELYLEAGVVVWLVDPNLRIVTVCRPNLSSEPLGMSDELSGEPELAGVRVIVATIFQV